jgi:adenylate kinase
VLRGVRLVLLGKQGAGKGTQCVQLSRHYVVPHISTGDIFRAAMKAGTPMGKLAKTFVDNGQLVPDEIVIGIAAERLSERDARSRGFILDGFPRTTHQAEALEKLLKPLNLDAVIDLAVSTELVLERLASRRVCSSCGHNYSVHVPPSHKWRCDHCGGDVIQRDDDREEAIKVRLDAYEAQTSPLITWYESRGLLDTIDGSRSPDEVFEAAVEAITRRHGGQITVSEPERT